MTRHELRALGTNSPSRIDSTGVLSTTPPNEAETPEKAQLQACHGEQRSDGDGTIRGRRVDVETVPARIEPIATVTAKSKLDIFDSAIRMMAIMIATISTLDRTMRPACSP